MWYRPSDTAKWHVIEAGETMSVCGIVDRPLDYVHAQADGEARPNQRQGAPERQDPVCGLCAKASGFRRRSPKKLHMDHDEILEALEGIVQSMNDLLERMRGSKR